MRWARFFRRKHWDDERRGEIDAYLEIETDDNITRGMPPEEARYAARRKLGNSTRIHEEIYRMNSIGLIETLWQDLRYAVRVLRKSPGFTSVAVLSLALGIGVNTAMFSVVNAVLLRSLPYPQPARLVRLAGQVNQADLTIPEFEFWKEHSRVFASIAGYRGGGERRLAVGSGTEWIKTMFVTADFLRTLGVSPLLGREFNSGETRAGGPQAVILSDSIWRRSYGADPQVIGRAITLDQASFTVAGVLPAGFWFPQAVDAFVPLRPSGSLGDRGSNTQVIARLKDGVLLRQAQAEMTTITESFRQANAGSISREYRGLMTFPYQDWLVGDVRVNLLLLFGATGLLLLIACSNLATLLLARSAARSKELAVRLALGGSWRRLLTQFLIENVVITALGAGTGLFAAYGLLQGLVAWMPFSLPASTPVRLDGAVFAFTFAVAAATALAFTLAPLLGAKRLNMHDALKASGRSAAADSVRVRTRNVMVVGEVALSTTLLIAAGLLIQTLFRMQQERLGFTPQGLITLDTPFAPERRASKVDRWNFTQAMLERLPMLTGVRGVAAINLLPLTGQSNLPTQRDGHPDQSIGGMEIRVVTPAYFELMGIPVRRGRSFTADDAAASGAVAIVNETVARSWWPKGGAIGDRVIIGRYQGKDLLKDAPRDVIGVVGDSKTRTLKEAPRPTVFVPLTQADAFAPGNLAWIVRTNGSASLGTELRRAIAEIDPQQRVLRIRTMDDIVSATTAGSRFNASLFTIFAGVALALAAIGVYGLLSYVVAQRRKEIGTRMALGARPADVLLVFLRQGLGLITIGLGLGLAGALFLTRSMSTLLYGVRPDDPWSFAAVSGLLLGVGLIASYLPALRATRIDPMVALRDE